MANNRELSQFASFVEVNDTSRHISVASTSGQYVGIGSTLPTVKVDVVGDVKVSGALTANSGTFTTGSITDLSGTNLNYTGVSTLTNLNGTNLSYTGISTVANFIITPSGIGATVGNAGIITYYGDGSYLDISANTSGGIGIATTGGLVGYGITFLNLFGAGVSTTFYDSAAGIATIYVEGGGGSGGTSTEIEVTNDTASATTHYITFTTGASSSQALKVDTSTLSYVPSTNNLTASTFTGALSGNATSATTATNATNTAITDTTASASTHYITFVDGASGNRAQRVDSTGLTYIPDTNVIGASISGNAATVTTNANLTGDVTSVGNATAIAAGVIVNADINASAAIAVSKLAASTISGVTLGSNLATLTRGTYLTGSNYNGSTARTWAVDATTTNTASKVVARDASGNFAANIITCVDLNSTSDINLKSDIRPFEDALATVNQLNGVHFTWKKDDRKSVGVIAQEIEAILPELVTEVEGHKTVNYNGLIGVLIEAVKELSDKVEQLENKVSK